jgi:hypothetical protein
MIMLVRNLTATIAVVLATALMPATGSAQEADNAKYPDWKGQWMRFAVPGFPGQPSHDQTKPWGLGQQAPLTPEYQAIYEANLKDQAAGGQGTTVTYKCLSPGMPRVANGYGPMEIVVTPETTYLLIDHILDDRRIFTDGRDWPKNLEPSYLGYSIGKWISSKGDGHYDVLEAETRGFKGPRTYDGTGIPLHSDNESIIKERIYLDQSDPDVAHDEVTVIDHALTRPWTVIKNFRRDPNPRPNWTEEACAENNHVVIGNEDYMLSADGLLMPQSKGQSPPDLRYFKSPR